MEEIKKLSFTWHIWWTGLEWSIDIHKGSEITVVVEAGTAPHAICLAYLEVKNGTN